MNLSKMLDSGGAKEWKAEAFDTPFAKAAQVVDRRDGAARVSADRAWIGCGVMTVAAFVSVAGWVYQAGQSGRVATYFVPIDAAGQPGRAIPVDERYTPAFAETAYFLGEFIRNGFSKPTDAKVLGDQVRRASGMLIGDAQSTYNQWAKERALTADIGREARTAEVVNVVETSARGTWQVTWDEVEWRDGVRRERNRMIGLFTVIVVPPKNQATLFSNPLGIYVKNLSWSKA